jgi:hypothetical protein
MTTRSKLDTLIANLKQSVRQGRGSLPAGKRRTIVRDHGTEGIRALLACDHPKWEVEVFELDAPDCPWPYPGISAGPVARRALGPLADRLPKLVAKLATAERVVAARHEAEDDSPDLGGWFLVYAVPSEQGPELWIAGPPEPAPELEIESWTLPEPLRQLYAQHNGLGVLCDEFGWTGVDPGVQALTRLAVPTFEDLDRGDATNPADLLRFTRGTGEAGESGWCFGRNGAICEFEDRFGLVGNSVPFDFWGFLDRYLIGDPRSELPMAPRL